VALVIIFDIMNNQQAVASKLLHLEAVKLSPENPFTWASGWKSPIYCDNRKILSFPYERDFIKSELCSVIFEQFPDADAIVGVATAGIAWGAMAADQLKLPFLYVRPKPKEHGMGNQIEGNYTAGQKVVIIEDLISTGKSSLQVCDVLKAVDVEILGMVSIFTYGFPQADQAFSEAGVKLISLTNYPFLAELAASQGIITPEFLPTLEAWRNDPSGWGK
jgi:orotate phosphoribosyltransferase